MDYQVMIWAGVYPPNADDVSWAAGKTYLLIWNPKVAEIMKISDCKERASKLMELADCLDAGIIVGHNEVDLMKVIRRLAKQETNA